MEATPLYWKLGAGWAPQTQLELPYTEPALSPSQACAYSVPLTLITARGCVPMLQMKKLRLRRWDRHVHRRTVSRWQSPLSAQISDSVRTARGSPVARPHRKRLAECRAVPSTQGQVDMVSSAFHSPAQPPGPRLTVTAEEGSPRDGHLPDVTQHLLWGQNLNLGLSGSPAPPPPPPVSLKHEVRSAAHHEVQCQCRGQPARPIPGPGQSHLLSTPKTLLL